MNENEINKLLDINNYIDLIKELKQIFPKGIDLEILDIRIKDKLKALQNKNYSIKKPIQIRKTERLLK